MDRKEQLKDKLRLIVGNECSSPQTTTPTSINGNHNVVAMGNINIEHKPAPVVQKLVPGEQHISDQQAYEIKQLVEKIVSLERYSKADAAKLGYAGVWSAFKRKFRVTRYQLLPAEQYEQAIHYLLNEVGKQSQNGKEQSQNEWRKRRYAYIHTNVKKLGLQEEKDDYLAINFGAASLKELNDDELQQVYAWVAKKKQAR
ncbi:ORF6C domain-containing protein [Catenovulum sediminis]|uniref:ORF6C domain-containing protein n=1 Tax=Catenovulum sediminis TaxID=1740262 RepID=UPI00117EBA6C|nr:ORF6C domain-containing protein [Catenovulum sediminis]